MAIFSIEQPKKKKCKCNEYKIALVIDDNNTPMKKDNDDFHFYRQDYQTDVWSHKPGNNKISRVDANGDLIFDPSIADRRYSKYNYDKFCGFYCLPYNEKNYTQSIQEI